MKMAFFVMNAEITLRLLSLLSALLVSDYIAIICLCHPSLMPSRSSGGILASFYGADHCFLVGGKLAKTSPFMCH
jgi:hypothetical protein